MEAENRTGEQSFSPTDAGGHCEYSKSAGQVISPVEQLYTTSIPQTPIAGAASVRILPTVHFSRQVRAANSVSTTMRSFAPDVRHATPISPSDRSLKRSVTINPVQQPQNILTRIVPAVHQAAHPAAVINLGNNGNVVNAVLDMLPNVGARIVHNVDPGSLLQNLVSVIDSGTCAVTTATAVLNLQPMLKLSYQGSMALPAGAAIQASSQIADPRVSGRQHSLRQPVSVSQVGSRVPLVANQPVAFSPSSVSIINTCPQQPPSLNPPTTRPVVAVRTIPSSSGQTHTLAFPVSSADVSRFPLLNSSEMIPWTKLPRTISSLSGAIVRYPTTTTSQTLQHRSVMLSTQPVSQIQPKTSLPVQSQLVTAVPSFATDILKTPVSGSSTDSVPGPSASLTTIVAPQPMLIPFDIPQAGVNVTSATDKLTVVHSATQSSTRSPLLTGSTITGMCQAGVQPAVAHPSKLVQIPSCIGITCYSNKSSSSLLSTHQTFASYVPPSLPILPAHHFSVPTVMLQQGQLSCSATTKKRSVKRQPRLKTTVLPCRSYETDLSQAKLIKPTFASSSISMPSQNLDSPVSSTPAAVNPLPDSASVHTSTGSSLAGVKRKCIPGQKYMLFLENGCKYSSVYFDGEGFQAKKPRTTLSSMLTGSCCYCLSMK